jgi:hypothetical protein
MENCQGPEKRSGHEGYGGNKKAYNTGLASCFLLVIRVYRQAKSVVVER